MPPSENQDLVDGQKYDPGSAVSLLELFGSFKSIQNGHGYIDHRTSASSLGTASTV